MFQVHFEVDVNGLASTKRFDETVFIQADDEKGARDKATAYIKNAYSETFAIFSIVRVPFIS